MAIGMKSWLGLVLGGLAVVVAAALPPSTMRARARWYEPPPEQQRFRQVRDEVRQTHGALQAMRWSDSLSALAVRTAVDGVALGAPHSHPFTREGFEEWRQLVHDNVASLDRRDPRMVVGIFMQRADHGAIPDLPLFGWPGRQTYVGALDDTPYCLQVEVDRFEVINADLRRNARAGLGVCRLYAMYGDPGPGVRSWLESGAMGFAVQSGDRGVRRAPQADVLRVPMFGLNRYYFAGDVTTLSCLAGNAISCERVVTDPALLMPAGASFVAANSPLAHAGGRIWRFTRNDGFILADLEAEFGSAAFERFWSSSAPLERAFESAFGLRFGDWLLGWVESELGLYRAGPASSASALWLSLLALMALAATATFVAMRRRVA